MNKIARILTILVVALLPMTAFAQAKKPTLMVIPSNTVKDDPEFPFVAAKIGELMAENGFPLKDLAAVLGVGDSLMRAAGSDILIEVMWKVNRIGPKRSVTYTLRGLDSYTMKQVASAGGTGNPSIATEIPVLLQEAVLEQMDLFQGQLQQHFDDLLENGREVSVGIGLGDDTGGLTLETEIEENQLSDIIDEWMAVSTVNHRYSLSNASEKNMLFEQVRIPLFADNGMAMDTRRFVMQLRQHLNQIGIQSKVVTKGLGRADLLILRKKQ